VLPTTNKPQEFDEEQIVVLNQPHQMVPSRNATSGIQNNVKLPYPSSCKNPQTSRHNFIFFK